MKKITVIVQIAFLALFFFLLLTGKPVLWLALFAASLVAALVFGRIYCGYACPMNTLMIPAERLAKKLKLQTDQTPRWLKSGWLSWAGFAVSVAVTLLSKLLLHKDLPVLPFWLILSVLMTLRYKPEVFHHLVCPFGTLQRVFGRFARRSQSVDKDACIGCKKCEKVCPAAAIKVSKDDKKAAIRPVLCHQCANCSQVCPVKAIRCRTISASRRDVYR